MLSRDLATAAGSEKELLATHWCGLTSPSTERGIRFQMELEMELEKASRKNPS